MHISQGKPTIMPSGTTEIHFTKNILKRKNEIQQNNQQLTSLSILTNYIAARGTNKQSFTRSTSRSFIYMFDKH